MTRVGFVVESGRAGADSKVLGHFVRRVRPDVEPVFEYLDNKRRLFAECGAVTAGLLSIERCKHVFVVWDLIPCDLLDEGRPSCVNERAAVLATLTRSGVDLRKVTLLCITYELEAWLLTDGAALTNLLERPTHPIRPPIRDDKRSEEDPNPKKTLQRLFQQHRGRDYLDTLHALQIAERIQKLEKVARTQSFARLRDRLLAVSRTDAADRGEGQ